MGWALVDQMLYREQAGAEHGLWGFGSLVFSLTNYTNPMTWYFNAGLVYQGIFAGRPDDTTGLAEKDYEAVIELNHTFVLGHGIAIEPDLQYIIRPAATGDIDNALAIGARLTIQF